MIENGKATCRCPVGFVGSLCHHVDPCRQKSACLNSGTCSVFFSAAEDQNDLKFSPLFNCTCPSGFTGTLCEIAVKNVCDKNPCENGATCQPMESTTSSEHYTCHCRPGFSGENCQISDETYCKNCSNGYLDGIFDVERPKKLEICQQDGGRWCRNEAQCILLANNDIGCKCSSGWRGERCDLDIDECQAIGSPVCQNGGTCSNSAGSFRCICVNGWHGDHCEINTNDCEAAHCFNGGTCHDRVATFNCECAPGFTGLLCHLRNACISNPCNAGAVCDTNPVDGSYVCSCSPGYKGGDCSQDVDECAPGNPCEHGGTCLNTPGSYKCLCPAGWTGMFCDQNINECATNPCLNDATCLDDVGKFICVCMPGFAGKHCETNVDECAQKPCQNGGFCSDAINNYTCRCPAGYHGRNCEFGLARPDLCSSKPCRNNGKCVELTGHYICRCPDEFYGVHCERRHLIKSATLSIATTTTLAPSTKFFKPAEPFDVITYDELDKINLAKCLANQCAKKANNGICDLECNYPICGYDGLDCSAGLDPFINCPAKDYCPNLFKNGKCDEACNNEACLFDGFDCMDRSDSICNPLYESYCIRHLGDGNCDSGCNTRGCNYDGGDCAHMAKKERSVLVGAVALVLTVNPDLFVNQSNNFLMALGKILDVNLKIKTDDQSRPMVYRWNSRDGVEGEPIDFGGGAKKAPRQTDRQIFSGVFVVLVVDVTKCTIDGRQDCFSKVESVANFLGASRAKEALKQELGWDIYSATPETESSQSAFARNVWLASVTALLVMIFFLLLVMERKRKLVSKLWSIPGSSMSKRYPPSISCAGSNFGAPSEKACPNLYESDLKCCRKMECEIPCSGYKQQYSHLDEYISSCQKAVNANQDLDQFSESGTYSTYACDSDITSTVVNNKRFKSAALNSDAIKCKAATNANDRNWSSEHKAAAGLKPEAKVFPSTVNVKGPDGQTPLMVASYAGKENEESMKMLEQLIACGASLDEQTLTNGDTALTLGIKCLRVQAVRTMLVRGADPNLADRDGFTALHHAVNTCSLEMVAAVLRHALKPLDLEARDALSGATPLILAAKQSARCTDIVELLLVNKVSTATQDDEGKTALHWAALQNDCALIVCLLTYGANKDAPDQHDQTPLMLAVREGHLEAMTTLLERGASKDMVDDVDRSPLQLALERGHEQLALVLDKWQQRPSPLIPSRPSQNTLALIEGATGTLGRRQANAKPKPPKRTKSLREPSSNNNGGEQQKSRTKKNDSSDAHNTSSSVSGNSPLSATSDVFMMTSSPSTVTTSGDAPSSLGGRSPAMSIESPPAFGGTPSPSSLAWQQRMLATAPLSQDLYGGHYGSGGAKEDVGLQQSAASGLQQADYSGADFYSSIKLAAMDQCGNGTGRRANNEKRQPHNNLQNIAPDFYATSAAAKMLDYDTARRLADQQHLAATSLEGAAFGVESRRFDEYMAAAACRYTDASSKFALPTLQQPISNEHQRLWLDDGHVTSTLPNSGAWQTSTIGGYTAYSTPRNESIVYNNSMDTVDRAF